MTIYAVKRSNETNERLIKRFKKQVHAARIVNEIRRRRYHSSSPKKRIIRKRAVMREKYRAKRARELFYS